LFTSLWNAAYDEYFEGNTVKVPFARPHQQLQMKAVFQKFGKILYYVWLLTKENPSSFLEGSLYLLTSWRKVCRQKHAGKVFSTLFEPV